MHTDNDASSSHPGDTPRIGAIITNELAVRQPRRLDPQEETHALQDLARQMLERPDLFCLTWCRLPCGSAMHALLVSVCMSPMRLKVMFFAGIT